MDSVMRGVYQTVHKWFRCSAIGRVGERRRGYRSRVANPASFQAGPQSRRTILGFHSPLVKPDVRISRIRLSDKDSCVRPRNVAITQAKLDQSQFPMQILIGEA
jgi:hypothetical protein